MIRQQDDGRLILALESSAGPASCALLRCGDGGTGRLVASACVHTLSLIHI